VCDELQIKSTDRKVNKPKSTIDQMNVLSQEVNDEEDINQETGEDEP